MYTHLSACSYPHYQAPFLVRTCTKQWIYIVVCLCKVMMPNWQCLHSTVWYFLCLKADVNLFKCWIVGALDWGHRNLWSCDINSHALVTLTAMEIISSFGFLDTRENISLFPPLSLVSHLPCSQTEPGGIRTHDHSHTKWASYHMTSEETLYLSRFHLG